jgi:hypothetical protein
MHDKFKANTLIKKTFIAIFCLGLLAMPVSAFAARPAQAVQTAQTAQDQAYLAAVDRAMANINSKNNPVDWTDLREKYVHSSFYNPQNGADDIWNRLQAAGQKALIDGTPASVKAYQALLRQYFAHYRSHLQAIEMIDRAHFTQEDKNFHLAALRGILSSILSSGDGKTAETAFHVIDQAEEGLVLKSYFHYQLKEQKYEQHGGHFWDIVSYVNPANGAADKMYFNVDALVKGQGG